MLLESLMKKIFGDPNEKELKKVQVYVDAVNALEKDIENMSDASLAAKTSEFRDRLAKGATLDDILPEAFAVVREASKRVLGLRHFDVQLAGGCVLHRGKISEMRTGEGKTLVATLPAYLNALTGKGVHVVTVNEYLARRDSQEMGRVYNFLGLSVGLIIHGLDFPERKAAYAADITYGTNNEFGFDYLRDNMVVSLDQMVQRPLNYAIVDEVDSILVDEFTGRLMFGRRFSEGLHQAIEAKEGVKVERESQTLATITFQNYFRMYDKLSGMTGTAKTEEQEFQKIYGLDVIVVPTNKPNQRIDYPDVIYKTKRAKYKAAADEIEECHKTGRPVLVGTTSIAQSEELSDILKKRGIAHNVLNAKFHEKEAEIIADAGQFGAVTIATNMAGRGTDIVLGEGVPALGGLHIIGTERHESRRIDNQLRGRCARQGDPGSTRFYLSLEDDLMRLFGSDNISGIMDKLGMEEDEPIEHSLVTKSIESAQKKVESRNFDMRKHVLEYDDVMNQQREVIYAQRKKILVENNLRDNIMDMVTRVVDRTMAMYAPPDVYSEDWDLPALIAYAEEFYAPPNTLTVEYLQSLSREELKEYLQKLAVDYYEQREESITPAIMRELENLVMLKVVDSHWMQHLDAMDMLREGVGLRAYGQRDPLVEYKLEAYDMFQAMIDAIQDDVVRYMYRVNVVTQPKVEDRLQNATVNNPSGDNEADAKKPVVKGETIGRNDPCPCGSGKKYKNCCGIEK